MRKIIWTAAAKSRRNEDYVFGNMSVITFKRQGTMGRGSDKCDFYVYKER